MTGHVVFVGLALVLCTAVPSANTTANADTHPEIIVGAEDVIIVRNIASTDHSSSETPKTSSPHFIVTSTELPANPTTSTTTTTETSTMQPAHETRTPASIDISTSPATDSVAEVVTSSASIEASTSERTLHVTVPEVAPTTRSWLPSHASTTTPAEVTETATDGRLSTPSSVHVDGGTEPTTTAAPSSSTSTHASPSTRAETLATNPSSMTPNERSPSAVPTSVVATSVASTTVPSTSAKTSTASSLSTEPIVVTAAGVADDKATETSISSASETTSSNRSGLTGPTTTPLPSSVPSGFRRTVNRMSSSTASPPTVTQLLQLHKTQELLRQAAVVARIRQRYTAAMRVFYQNGNSEADLPECSAMQVCNKVDVYSTPWVERQCRCPARTTCSKSVDAADGHTVSDKSRLYKTCEPVKELPECRFFRDATWTIEQTASNHTRQTLHCTCPKNAVAYLAKYELVPNVSGVNFKYSFACSPQVRQKCQAAEPCRLFTVKKRRVVDEVNSDTLCDCPAQQWCPSHHTDSSISPGSFFKEDHLKIFTGFCQPVV